MNFLDINSSYCPSGGGVRTFHHAKIDWFARHPEHAYWFVYPAARRVVHRPHDNVRAIGVCGPPMGNGYRLLVDFRQAWRLLRDVRPDVIEAGDPLSSVPFCRLARYARRQRGLLAALWHSDPYETWVEPRLLRAGRLSRARGCAAAVVSACWYRRFHLFDLNVSTSGAVEERLHRFGVPRVVRLPLGIDGAFFDRPADAHPGADARRHAGPWTPERPLELLFAGRLDPDKGIDVVLAVLPRLLDDPRVRVTIAGRGVREPSVSRLAHPRFRYLGYVNDRRALAEIFQRHHVLLSPGPHETFGLSALEAMASGLVVVGTDVGGVGEFLRRIASPFRFAPWDAEGLHRAVFATLEANLVEHSRRARALAAEYGTWDDAMGRLIGCYLEHIGTPRDASRRTPQPPHARFGGRHESSGATEPGRTSRAGC